MTSSTHRRTPYSGSSGVSLPGMPWGLALLLVGFSLPASALPLLDLSAGLYGAYDLNAGSSNAFGTDLDAYIGTPFVKVSGDLLTVGRGSVGDLTVRFEPLPLPFIGLRPGIGYQGNTVFKTGTFDHAPYGSLLVAVGMPLIPVSAEAQIGASYPLSLGQPVFGYSANLNLSPIPLVPVAISARYRGYLLGLGFTSALSAIEAGLRVTL